jgi:hypothetical protein
MTARNDMLRRLHANVRLARIDDTTYRDRLEREFGKRSAKDLSDAELARAVELFPVKHKSTFPHTRLAKALWIALSNLGAVDRRDVALDAFVHRQTGKQRLAFLTPPEGNSVTEALKAMCGREGLTLKGDPITDRRALLVAQWKKLAAMGVARIEHEWALASWLDRELGLCHGGSAKLTREQLDMAAKKLGAWIRKERDAAAKIEARRKSA